MKERQGKPVTIPIEAQRRSWLFIVTHAGDDLDRPEIQAIFSRWVTHGDLSQEDWNTLKKAARRLVERGRAMPQTGWGHEAS